MTIFEMNAAQMEIKGIINFIKYNLYHSTNYNFASSTQAINVPYGDTDNFEKLIWQFGNAKNLTALQNNINTLYRRSSLSRNPSVADGLAWLLNHRNPPVIGNKGVIIVVGFHNDESPSLTSAYLGSLRSQGYKVFSVAVGAGHGDLSSIADKPEWYFQVNQSNGQYVADQISSFLCNL